MTVRHGFSVEYWSTNLRPHAIGCRCAPNGWDCEQAQAVAEETAERQAGRYPCGALAPHAAQACPACRRAWGYSEEAGW